MKQVVTITLAAVLALVTALGCSSEGSRGKNSDKDRPKPAPTGN